MPKIELNGPHLSRRGRLPRVGGAPLQEGNAAMRDRTGRFACACRRYRGRRSTSCPDSDL